MGTFDEDDIDNDDDDSFWRVSNEKLRAQNAKDVGENQNDGVSESRQRRCRLCLAGKNENMLAKLEGAVVIQEKVLQMESLLKASP